MTTPPPPSLCQSWKLEAIGQLAEGVAHDFSDFLTVIQGHSALLLAEPYLSPENRAALTAIHTAGERAANLIRQLLVFSGKQELRRQTLNLNDLVRNADGMLRHLVGEAVALQLDYAAELPMVSADADLLEQALVNLATNAREALPQGGQLRVQTARVVIDGEHARQNPEARPGEFVCLSARDTGRGIAPEILPRLFEPFFTTKAPGKGAGLGLATVYGIVKQHEGWVEVESQVGHGTTFKIFLPAHGCIKLSSPLLCTAGFQPAVSPTSSRPDHDRPEVCGLEIRDTADLKSAVHGAGLRTAGFQPAVSPTSSRQDSEPFGQPAVTTRPPQGTETLLVVEDEASMRELAVLVLKRCGYRVLEAASGVEALQVWARHQPRIELLFTDLVLPDELAGWTLAEKLQAEKPGLKVIYTSSCRPDRMSRVYALNEKIHFLQKPYHPSQLAATVRLVLDEL